MSSSGGSFYNVNNSFSSVHQLPGEKKVILELDTLGTVSHQDTKWQYTGNRDDFHNASANTTLDPEYSEEEKILLKKIDLFVMPIVCMLDFLQYLDKSTLNYAGLMTLKDDVNLEGNQYSLLGSIFYLGYLLFQLPNNYLLQRIAVGKYIGSIVVLWGIVLVCTAFGTNFSQIAAMRFLLGFFEAGIYPSLTILISTLYRRSEQVVRLAAFWVFNGFALMAGGLIAFGINHMVNVGGLKSWQWIMIILGAITILMGIVTFFFLIDSPKSTALQLNAEQEMLVDERTKDNATVRTSEIKTEHIWEAVKEIRFWCYCLACLLINLQNGAMSIYNGQIGAMLGFNEVQSMLLSAGSGASTIAFLAITVFIFRKTHQNIYTACLLMAINVTGLILLLTIPIPRLKLIGFYMSWTYCSVYVLLVTSVSNNVTGYTKKIFFNGVLMISYTIGNVLGPLLMNPPYIDAIVIYLVANSFVIVLLLIARNRMALINKRRLLSLAHTSASSTSHSYCRDDISDQQDQTFIYLL